MPNPLTPVKTDNLRVIPLAQRGPEIPKEGAKAIIFNPDFTAADSYVLDFLTLLDTAKIASVETLYIDNNGNTVAVLVTLGSGQQILAKPNTQGYYQIANTNPQKLVIASPTGSAARILLLNYPVPGSVWPTT